MPKFACSPPVTTPTPTVLSGKGVVEASAPLKLEMINNTASVSSALDMLADAASGGIAFTLLDVIASVALSSRQNSALSPLC